MLFANFKVVRFMMYDNCCELDLYLASEIICACKPYIPRCMLDYEPPRAILIPLNLLIKDYRVLSSTLSWDQVIISIRPI